MAEFKYEALDQNGKAASGVVNAGSQESAIASLQQKGLTITSIQGGGNKTLLQQMRTITVFGGVSSRDLVILSRQIATLFEAQVSALRVFRLLAEQSEKPFLRQVLAEISDDLQGGNSISKSLEKHPKVFSDFYVNMVRAGEESGKLDQTFLFLADYIDRSYELGSKARNALIYPAFILVTFVAVMTLMLTLVIPKIGAILQDSGQILPLYTRIILGLSTFLTDYGVFLLIALIIGGYLVYRYVQTSPGKIAFSRFKFSIPYVGSLYQKLYLSRIADNMNVMLTSGISAVRALEITANVVEDHIYEGILREAIEGVKSGSPLSQNLARYTPLYIPGIFVQMLQIGEETGEMGNILSRLAKFYNREVNAAVDTLVSLIEPILIVGLALGVGFLLAAVLLPIYNSASNL
ncbi:type II secretion system F family protein [Candidatus Kaiserbacteria bacterium]|nr:type II secretion system F family protein [Candidatus Kaiserbacteria bacterium]